MKNSRQQVPNLTRAAFLRGALALPFAAAFPAPRPSSALSVQLSEIASNVFVHKGQNALFSPQNSGDIANVGIVVGSRTVAVIDTGGSANVGHAVRTAIRGITDLPVGYVINTHMHPDHVFGNAAFVDDGAQFVGHHKLARGVLARADRYLTINKELLGEAAFAGTKIIPPSMTVEDRREIDLGGRTLLLTAQKTAHTDNDLTVRDLASDTLFMGDLLFAEHVPTIDGSIVGWLTLIDRLTQDPAARVVPGHGPVSMQWPAAAAALMRYLSRLTADIRQMIKDGRTMSDATHAAGLAEKNAWLLFDEYHARNVAAAFAELEWD